MNALVEFAKEIEALAQDWDDRSDPLIAPKSASARRYMFTDAAQTARLIAEMARDKARKQS